jgi:hypothetical protein
MEILSWLSLALFFFFSSVMYVVCSVVTKKWRFLWKILSPNGSVYCNAGCKEVRLANSRLFLIHETTNQSGVRWTANSQVLIPGSRLLSEQSFIGILGMYEGDQLSGIVTCFTPDDGNRSTFRNVNCNCA